MEQVWGLTENGQQFDDSVAEKVNMCISWESAQRFAWEEPEVALFLVYCISGEGFYSAAELDNACSSMKPLTYTCEKCAATVAAVDWILRANGKRTPDTGPSKPSWLPSSIWGWQTVGTPKVSSYTPSAPAISSPLTYITQNICPHFVNSEKAFLADLEIPEGANIGDDEKSARLDIETSNIFTTVADYSKLPMSCWLGYREKMVAYFRLDPQVFKEEAPPAYPPLQEVTEPEYINLETVRVPEKLRKAELEWKLREGVRNLEIESEMSRDPDKYRAAARELKISEKRNRQQKEKADREKREKAKARAEEANSAAWSNWKQGLKEAERAELENIPPEFQGVTDDEVDKYYEAIGQERPARDKERYPGTPSGNHLLISKDVWQDIIQWKESPVYVMLISSALKILKPPQFSKYEVVAERNPMVKSALNLISDNWNSFLPMAIYDEYLAGMDRLFETVDKLSYLQPGSDENTFEALLGGRKSVAARVMVQKTLKDLDDGLVRAVRAGFDKFLAKIAQETSRKEDVTVFGFPTGITTTPEATDVVNKKLLPQVKARFNQRVESFAQTANVQHNRLNKQEAPPTGNAEDTWGTA